MNYRWIPCSILAAGLSLAAACDDPGDGETGATASTGSASTGATSSNPTATSTTPGMTEGSASDPGETSGSTGPDDDTGAGGSGDTTAATTEPMSTSSGSGGGVCDGLDRASCMGEPACMAIGGAPLEMPEDGVCWGEREFVECQPIMDCGEAISYSCAGEGETIYQFPNTCVPLGWIECIPPPVEIPSCS